MIISLYNMEQSQRSDRASLLTHLLDVLQGDPVLPELLVDEDQGVQVAHPPIEQLVGKPTRAFHHSLVKQQQPGGGPEESGSSADWRERHYNKYVKQTKTGGGGSHILLPLEMTELSK